MVGFDVMNKRIKLLGGVKIYNRRNRNTPRGVIYGGRPTILGNPFVVGRHGIQGECCNLFEAWLMTGQWRHIKDIDCPEATEDKRLAILTMLPELEGKDLECWCWPDRCHLETVAYLANFETVGKMENVDKFLELELKRLQEFTISIRPSIRPQDLTGNK